MGILPCFDFYVVTRSYSSRPLLCTLDSTDQNVCKHNWSTIFLPFQVLCAGRCDYITSDGVSAVDEDSLTQYTSGIVGQMLLESLQMNFNYSCVVTEEVSGTNHILSKPVLFSTAHGGIHSNAVCVKLCCQLLWGYWQSNMLVLFLTNEPSALARCLVWCWP